MNRQALFAGASIVAFALSPALAQTAPDAPSQQEDQGLEYPAPDRNATDHALTEQDIRQLRDDRPKASRAPDAEAANRDGSTEIHTREDSSMPFPPPDVSDADLESWAERARGAREAENQTARSEQSETTSSVDPIVEGEVIPEDFHSYQGPDAWEGQGEQDVDGEDDWKEVWRGRTEIPSGQIGSSAERGPAGAWDGRYEGDLSGSPHAGDRQPDRAGQDGAPAKQTDTNAERNEPAAAQQSASRASERDRSARSDRADAGERDGISREDRERYNRRAGGMALAIARRVMPSVDFKTYSYGIDGRRLFEFAGTDRDTGRRVEVDVLANGRIEEVEEQVPLRVVPERVRSQVRDVLGRFWVVRAERSLRADNQTFYEFDGRTASGRPLSVEIRDDGRRLKIEEARRG